MCTPILVSVLLCFGNALELAQRSSAKAKVGVKVEAAAKLGVMSRAGVTRYRHGRIKAVKSANEFFWANSGGKQGQFGSSGFVGPVDLIENVSWGWRHPNGVYNTIPAGGPLIDDEMNMYVSSDDAVRKFDTLGGLMWSYAPRGMLASAPSLLKGSDLAPRVSDGSSMLLKIGDRVEVLPGKVYHAKGKEYYRTGDVGEVSKVVVSGRGEPRAVIRWARTGHASSTLLTSWRQKFARAQEGGSAIQQASPALYGTTMDGYAFAVDMETGNELWATKLSGLIAGVKGSVAAKGTVLVVASDKCANKHCYRYRNEIHNMMPSNDVVRGLNSVNGSALWSFKPDSPVWNFVPHFTDEGTVLFQDFEGSLYSLNASTGELAWKQEGNMGMYTQSAAAYSAELNMVYSITEKFYDNKWCNPYKPPGILMKGCNTMQYTPGLVRAFDASTGSRRWKARLPMPPAGASLGRLNSGGGRVQLVVGMGLGCAYSGTDISKPSELWAINANNGNLLWKRSGPTLWTPECAGDKEGADIRRAMGTRTKCQPNSWTNPVIDGAGDIFIGNHVGMLQKWGSVDGSPQSVQLRSTLSTGSALVDQSIALAPGMMAVATCHSLIVLET